MSEDKGVLGNIERAEASNHRNKVLQRATKAVAKARADGIGFDDEIARAVIEALREPTIEVLDAAWDAFSSSEEIRSLGKIMVLSDGVKRAYVAGISEILR